MTTVAAPGSVCIAPERAATHGSTCEASKTLPADEAQATDPELRRRSDAYHSERTQAFQSFSSSSTSS